MDRMGVSPFNWAAHRDEARAGALDAISTW
jgi:hypothetical protein